MSDTRDTADDRQRCEELEQELERLQRINTALMDRVERDMDRQGNSFSLFQAATALEKQVADRTATLQKTLRALERTNHELAASNEAAQAASRAKSAFLAAMSHELRTPMNGVIGMVELLLASEMTVEQRHSVGVVRQSALSLLTILNDILDFSKIEAEQMRFESTPFDLSHTTHEVVELLKPQAIAKGLDLVAECATEMPPHVVGDPTRFRQIMTNLIGNAIKFTAQGSVRIGGRVVEQQGEHRLYRFEVTDTGIGIPADVIPRLFSAFTQADSSTTRKFGGTGLGLVIVKRLCNLMGGDCGVDSTVGRGSTFWFTLRLQADARTERLRQLAPDVRVAAPARVDSASPMHVLVAEDNAVNQQVVVAMLKANGCTSRVVKDGREALAALDEGGGFDLVLMDCQMPELDGYETSRAIRAREQQQGGHIPIVALTANAMSGDREACLAAGMDDFLSKPFRMHEIRAVLDKWRGVVVPAPQRLRAGS